MINQILYMTGAKAQVLAAIKIHELKLVAIDIEICADTPVFHLRNRKKLGE